MTTFAIDTDNTITAYAAGDAIPAEHAPFNTEKDLAKLAANWHSDRLIEVWNSFAGVPPFGDLKPVRKFTDRKTAVARIWKAVQVLTPAPKAVQEAKPAEQKAAREGSKKAIVLDMLRRPTGATLAEIMSATGWQAHSVRGFISGGLTKKMGIKIESFKSEGKERAYRVAQ